MAVIVALGCSRLDVIGRIGDALGLVGAVDDLRRADGVTVSEDRVLVDARVADVPVLDHDVLQRAGRVAAEQLAVGAERSLLVARACPMALRRLEQLPTLPSGVVVVRDRRRSVTWHDVAAAAGAPVVAELEVDPAVAAAVDAGLDRRSLPRAYLRVLDGLR